VSGKKRDNLGKRRRNINKRKGGRTKLVIRSSHITKKGDQGDGEGPKGG